MRDVYAQTNDELIGKQTNLTLLIPDATEVSSIDFGFSLAKFGFRLLIVLNSLFNIYAGGFNI